LAAYFEEWIEFWSDEKMKPMKGSATMNRERTMPTMIAMAGKKNIAIVAHAHGIGLRPISFCHCP
jgi:hypothetical protein